MILYEYKCKKCGRMEDKLNEVENHKNGPECCGEVMVQHIGNYMVARDLEPYVDYNLGKEPVYVKSKQHRKKLMKENGVFENYGKGWR